MEKIYNCGKNFLWGLTSDRIIFTINSIAGDSIRPVFSTMNI
jgi:hypothetical protein